MYVRHCCTRVPRDKHGRAVARCSASDSSHRVTSYSPNFVSLDSRSHYDRSNGRRYPGHPCPHGDGSNACANTAGARPAAHGERHADRVRVRRRSVERAASRRRSEAPDDRSPASSRTRRSRPTGSSIAFSGQYDGNIDVFVMPSQGGVPRRLTWHPERRRRARAGRADGKKVLFSSPRTQLFAVP